MNTSTNTEPTSGYVWIDAWDSDSRASTVTPCVGLRENLTKGVLQELLVIEQIGTHTRELCKYVLSREQTDGFLGLTGRFGHQSLQTM